MSKPQADGAFYIVEHVWERRKIGGKVEFLTSWVGSKKKTWEPRSNFSAESLKEIEELEQIFDGRLPKPQWLFNHEEMKRAGVNVLIHDYEYFLKKKAKSGAVADTVRSSSRARPDKRQSTEESKSKHRICVNDADDGDDEATPSAPKRGRPRKLASSACTASSNRANLSMESADAAPKKGRARKNLTNSEPQLSQRSRSQRRARVSSVKAEDGRDNNSSSDLLIHANDNEELIEKCDEKIASSTPFIASGEHPITEVMPAKRGRTKKKKSGVSEMGPQPLALADIHVLNAGKEEVQKDHPIDDTLQLEEDPLEERPKIDQSVWSVGEKDVLDVPSTNVAVNVDEKTAPDELVLEEHSLQCTPPTPAASTAVDLVQQKCTEEGTEDADTADSDDPSCSNETIPQQATPSICSTASAVALNRPKTRLEEFTMLTHVQILKALRKLTVPDPILEIFERNQINGARLLPMTEGQMSCLFNIPSEWIVIIRSFVVGITAPVSTGRDEVAELTAEQVGEVIANLRASDAVRAAFQGIDGRRLAALTTEEMENDLGVGHDWAAKISGFLDGRIEYALLQRSDETTTAYAERLKAVGIVLNR